MKEIMINVERHLFKKLLNNVHRIFLLLRSKILMKYFFKQSLFFSGGSTVIQSYSDIEKFRSRCGPSHGVMLCQAAMWNPSIFRPNGLLPIYEVAKRFLEIVNLIFDFFIK